MKTLHQIFDSYEEEFYAHYDSTTEDLVCWELPFSWGVELNWDDLQAIPSCHTGSIEEALPTYNGPRAEA